MKRRSGTSLVEILAALFVVSLVLTFVAAGYLAVWRAVDHSSARWGAVQLAYDEIQRRRLGSGQRGDRWQVVQPGVRFGREFSRTYEGTDVVDGRVITVRVTWRDGTGSHQATVSTVVRS